MKTTINSPLFILDQIDKLLKNSTMTPNQLINTCLSKYLNRLCKKSPNKQNLPLQYQPRGVKYKITPITFCWDSYDMNRLCRFAHRYSISMMVTTAIQLYAKEIVKQMDLKNNCYNYYILQFVVSRINASQCKKTYKIVIINTKEGTSKQKEPRKT